MTGFTAEGEECIKGVMQINGMAGERRIILQIGDETIERVDQFDSGLPSTQYICGDGSNFVVPIDQTTLADACMFGPNAKPCGFLKPASVETVGDSVNADEEAESDTEEAQSESEENETEE